MNIKLPASSASVFSPHTIAKANLADLALNSGEWLRRFLCPTFRFVMRGVSSPQFQRTIAALPASRGRFVDIDVDDKIHDAAFVVSAKLAVAPRVSEQNDSAGTGIGSIPPFQGRRMGYFYL